VLGIDRDLDEFPDAGLEQDHLQVAVKIGNHAKFEVVRQFLQQGAAAREPFGRFFGEAGRDTIGEVIAFAPEAREMPANANRNTGPAALGHP
jgi:hypothetical protein